MFNKPRQSGDKTRSASSAFDEVLAELEATGSPEEEAVSDPHDGPSAVEGEPAATEPVAEHTATLRATRDAQQQAQALLEMASRTRSDAIEQAEQIVLEARDHAEQMTGEATAEAERKRRETIDWVNAQRARIEAATAKIAEDAEHDAETIRSEAMRSAMAEAEQTARVYVGEAAARGARDAEEIRAKARDVLHRATDLAADIQASIAEMMRALELAGSQVRSKLDTIDALLEQTRPDVPANTSTDVEPHESAEPAEALDAAEPGETTEPDEPDEPDETDDSGATDEQESAAPGKGSERPAQSAKKKRAGSARAKDEATGEGRQLGAMFRAADSPEA